MLSRSLFMCSFYTHGSCHLVFFTLTSPVHTVCWSSLLAVNVPAAVEPSAITLPCIRNPRKSVLSLLPDSTTAEKTRLQHLYNLYN